MIYAGLSGTCHMLAIRYTVYTLKVIRYGVLYAYDACMACYYLHTTRRA